MWVKILIADDDNSSRILLGHILKEVCRDILLAKNGEEAVELCKNNPDIDIILMAMKMPKTDGFEATRKIRKFNKDVIIIAQTAFAQTSEIETAFEAGCNDHIPKPIVKKHLFSLIDKCIKKP